MQTAKERIDELRSLSKEPYGIVPTSCKTHRVGNQNAASKAALVIAHISSSCVTPSDNSAANRLTAGCRKTDKSIFFPSATAYDRSTSISAGFPSTEPLLLMLPSGFLVLLKFGISVSIP